MLDSISLGLLPLFCFQFFRTTNYSPRISRSPKVDPSLCYWSKCTNLNFSSCVFSCFSAVILGMGEKQALKPNWSNSWSRLEFNSLVSETLSKRTINQKNLERRWKDIDQKGSKLITLAITLAEMAKIRFLTDATLPYNN